MTQQEWARVTELLEQILEQPEEEALLLEGETAVVRDELRRLLGATRVHAPKGPSSVIGWIANRYERLSLLGSGGSGEAWLAMDHECERQVVVKMPLHWEWFRDNLTERFLAEAEILRRLEHPGIVGMLDSGATVPGEPYFVMPYVEGRSLRAHMGDGVMAAPVVADIVEQLGEALECAHAAQVIHRDIKPENVMLRPEAGRLRVVLIDFGIAQIADLQVSGGTTTKFFGTTRYMAPEQLLGNPTFASDVYALALLAYEMLTGESLFRSESPVGLYEEQKKFRVSGMSPLVPEHVREGIAAGLQSDPKKRPGAGEFGRELAVRLRSQTWPWRPSRRLVLASAATAVASAGTYFYIHRPIPLEERRVHYVAGQTYTEVGWRAIGKIDLDVTVFAPGGGKILGNRLASSDQGAYMRRLSPRVLREGLTRAWRLKLQVMPIHGDVNFGISFPELGVRFNAAAVLPDEEPPFLSALQQLRPEVKLLTRAVPFERDKFTELQLAFDPATKRIGVLVDGKIILPEYSGSHEFLGAGGLGIGFSPHKSKRGEGIFGDLTFEMD